jgi:23S rRNA maturation mini-RNase III
MNLQLLNETIEKYQKQYDEAVKRNENSDPNSIDKSNRIEYYMSMSEYTTLECVLRSLKKLKGEQK